jgi:hypothetical protein
MEPRRSVMRNHAVFSCLRASLFVCSLVVLSSIFARRLAAQDDQYRRLADLATTAMGEHRLDDALAVFREMHAMLPSARTLWSLGRVHYERGEYVLAIGYLDEALVDPRRPLSADALVEATALRDRARALTGEIQILVTPSDATVLVDDVETSARTLRLDPGAHAIRFERSGYEPGARRVEIRGGEALRVEVELDQRGPRDAGTIREPALPVGPMPVEVASESPGLSLHLQPLSMDRSRGPSGPRERVCEAPCSVTLPAGMYEASVALGDAQPLFTGTTIPLTRPMRIDIAYVGPGDSQRDWAIVASALFAAGVAGVVIGAYDLADSGDSAGPVLLLGGGLLVTLFGVFSLPFAVTEGSSQAYVRAMPLEE